MMEWMRLIQDGIIINPQISNHTTNMNINIDRHNMSMDMNMNKMNMNMNKMIEQDRYKCKQQMGMGSMLYEMVGCKIILYIILLSSLIVLPHAKLIPYNHINTNYTMHRNTTLVFGLHNHTFIYQTYNHNSNNNSSNSSNSNNSSSIGGYYSWSMVELQTNRWSAINASTYSTHVNAYTNHIDQLVICAIDDAGHPYVQMLDLLANTHYNLTLATTIDHATYIDHHTLLLIQAHRAFRGSLKMNNFIQLHYHLPPTATHIQCTHDRCVWLMQQGILVHYAYPPTLNTTQQIQIQIEGIGIEGDKIVRVQMGNVNDSEYMYTGTQLGLIYQWKLTRSQQQQQYAITRILYNLAGSPIADMVLLSNCTLICINQHHTISYIYLNNTTLTDTFQFPHPTHITIIYSNSNNNNDKDMGIVMYYSNNINTQSYYQLYHYVPTIGTISYSNHTTFMDIACDTNISQSTHTYTYPYTYTYIQTYKIYQCYFNDAIVHNQYNNYYIDGCHKYIPRPQPICYACISPYTLISTPSPLSTPSSQRSLSYQITTCRPSLKSALPFFYDANQIDMSDQFKSAFYGLNSIMLAAQTPFFYVKNILQLTLFSFVVHNFLSFWILASLYYFLPVQASFIKQILLLMWKTYSLPTLSIFGFQNARLPQLNNQPSTMDYGDVIIPNDFFQFTFDPFCMLIIMTINYAAFYYIRKTLRKKILAKTKLKLQWLKFDLFESASDIIIQIFPVVFLPCTNFLFNPTFHSASQKINLILFSALGGFTVIFPFFYFAKLIKDKKYDEPIPSIDKKYLLNQSKSITSKNIQENTNPIKLNNLIDKNKDQTKDNNKEKQKSRPLIKNSKSKQKNQQKNKLQQIKLFLMDKSKYFDNFFDCLLSLTIPVSVTLDSTVPFFIVNGLIISLTVVNSLFLRKGRLNTFLYRFYMFLYHGCFILMEILKQGEVFNFIGIFAIVLMVIYMFHQILQFIYKVAKLVQDLVKDWKRRNIIDNQRYIQKQAWKKSVSRLIQNSRLTQNNQSCNDIFIQTIYIKDMIKKNKLLKQQKQRIQFQQMIQKLNRNKKQVQEQLFFKQNPKIEEEQILPFSSALSSIAEIKNDKKNTKMRRQRLPRKYSIMTVQNNNQSEQLLDDLCLQRQFSQESKPIKFSENRPKKPAKWK